MKYKSLLITFLIPLVVLVGIGLYLLLLFFHLNVLAFPLVLFIIGLGSYPLLKETIEDVLHGHYALDYLAILAIVVSLLTQEYLVASVIALMLATGRTLEDYGVQLAKSSLTQLADRIPQEVTLWIDKRPDGKKQITQVTVGEEIFVRRGEVIPLDGILLSQAGQIDESSLTGEPYPVEKLQDDSIRSGTVNVGNPLVLRVTKVEKDSTYKHIVKLVETAQGEKAPLVRLADHYSTVFTLISLTIAGFAYFISHDIHRVLSVLVIATPCPLILATPIALLGGVNASAKKRIIVKRLASLEALSKTNAIIFDKTGTITIGKPVVSQFEVETKNLDEKELLGIAQAIERHSLHPLAKAIVTFAQQKNAPLLHADQIQETIGKGISGVINKKTYTLAKHDEKEGMAIALSNGKTVLGVLHFTDEIKQDAKTIINKLQHMGLTLAIFTGDKKQAADQVTKALGGDVEVKAECTPEDKQNGIALLKKQGKTIAMIGDGINDAPALALADVGMVFTNEEQTAASEAADIVFLGGEFKQVEEALHISKQTIHIALTSIFLGIGISIFGMLFASVGLIPPLIGALIQEGIDVIAIVNSLRASRIT